MIPQPSKPGPSLHTKLAQVMGEIGHVQKRGYNDFHKYHYVLEADLVDAVRQKLAERNVSLIPAVDHITEREFATRSGVSTLTTVHMVFTFVDGDTGETFVAQWSGAGDDPADKGLYKAYTGAVKFFLMKTFLIPTGDDPEGDTKTDERAGERAESGPPRRSGDRPRGMGVGDPNADPTAAQLKFLDQLKNRVKPNEDEREALLAAVGAQEGEKLNKGQVSGLIEILKEGNLPTGKSDVPDAGEGEFVHAPVDDDGQELFSPEAPS